MPPPLPVPEPLAVMLGCLPGCSGYRGCPQGRAHAVPLKTGSAHRAASAAVCAARAAAAAPSSIQHRPRLSPGLFGIFNSAVLMVEVTGSVQSSPSPAAQARSSAVPAGEAGSCCPGDVLGSGRVGAAPGPRAACRGCHCTGEGPAGERA